MTSRGRVLLAGAAAFAVAGSLTACAPGTDAGGENGADGDRVQIRVATFPPGADKAAYEAFAAQEAQFEKEHPNIDVVGVEYEWKGPTFAVQLAGGSLPDVFTVPFTDTKTLLENGQLLDVTDAVKELGYADAFNPIILGEVTGPDGKIYGFPRQAYAMGLHYNRELFTQAGLDPDKPPTTWDEIREYAKTISEKTGKSGFAQMASGNTGGWQLTAATVARGERTQIDAQDGSATSTVDNEATRKALQFLHDVRWEDDAFGSKFDLDWGTINQEFAAGNVGMYVSGSDVYSALVRDFGMKPENYGLGVVPTEGKDPGTLGGGDVAVVSPKVSDDAKAAAITWIDWYYMQKLLDKDAAVLDAQTLADAGQAVGTPVLPVLSREQYEESLVWIQDYINVPRDQMKPFIDSIWEQTPVGQPKKKTQEVYALLDKLVQTVLTDRNADIAALVKQGQTDAQALLDD